MFDAHKALEESDERREHLRANPTIAITAAILAVFAALATMLANHYSIEALTTKNEAILQMSRAADAYNYYESKNIKYHLYSALIAADIAKDARGKAQLASVAASEKKEEPPILKKAQALEKSSTTNQERAERFLNSYEMLDVTSTLFEVGIVFVSISALTRTRFLIYMGGVLAVVGVVYGIFALLHST